MSPLPKRRPTLKEQILGEKKAKESQVKKIEGINSLLIEKKLEADRNYLVKKMGQINTEWDCLWNRVHARGATSADKEKIAVIKKRATELNSKFEQKANFAKLKGNNLLYSQYAKMLGVIEKRLMRRLR